MTATAVTSVCIEPPTLLICANNATSTHGALSRSGRFCVNILRSFQAELSKAFSGTVKGDERFRLGDWRLAPDGLPFLADAQANLFCTVDQAVHYHSHTIFVARVDAITAGKEVDPLVYQDGAYAVARPVLESGAPRA